VGIERADGSQLALIVTVPLGIGLFGDDLTPELRKASFKELRQPSTVRRVEIEHDSGGSRFERVGRKLSHHCALKWIYETNAEDVITYSRYCWCRRCWRDHRNMTRLSFRSSR